LFVRDHSGRDKIASPQSISPVQRLWIPSTSLCSVPE
jgi:hypothetical protein